MKIERVSGKDERRIVTAMLVDKIALGRIAAKWQPDHEMFRSKWANIVGDLCVEYHKQYGKAPKRAIEPLFEAWATSRKRDGDTVALVEKFLGGLSSEYESIAEDINGPHMVDLAGKHFTQVKLERLRDLIEGNLGLGKVKEAEELVRNFDAVKLGAGNYIDVLQDGSALDKAFAEKEEPLLLLSGGLGKFFGYSLKRGAFISFLAPEKVGKTTNLVAFSWLAMLARLRVAFFSCGDESEDEMMLRFAQRAARRPLYPDKLQFPTDLILEKGKPVVRYERRDFTEGLSVKAARETFAKVQQEKLRSKKSYLRLATYAAGELSVRGISDQLSEWAREGWVADVIAIDYMENLQESGNPRDEPRHRISATWREARGLGMNHHALVLTATQANAAATTATHLTRDNFSESKTKLAHVTGMVGINQSDEEKAAGVLRLNWVVRRGAFFVSRRSCFCAGSFAVQNPLMRTHF